MGGPLSFKRLEGVGVGVYRDGGGECESQSAMLTENLNASSNLEL